MMICRPVQYTSRIDEYRELLSALGLSALPSDQGGDGSADWSVFQAGSGRVALHRVDPGDPLDGAAALGFETDELDEAATRLAAVTSVRRFERSHGRAIEATAPDGLPLVLLAPTPGSSTPQVPALAALGLWLTADTQRAIGVLETLGLRGEMRSKSGVWFQARADGGGLAAVHDGGSAVAQLSFEYAGDVTVLQQRLERSGVGTSLVDESYGRTLLVDRPVGGEPLWVNERQTDRYGYVALSAGEVASGAKTV